MLAIKRNSLFLEASPSFHCQEPRHWAPLAFGDEGFVGLLLCSHFNTLDALSPAPQRRPVDVELADEGLGAFAASAFLRFFMGDDLTI
ncbi:hypothetical protein GN958_ATG05940 [Phytophthora infestans]|uniref:Uncharacterized protein n=1 Tax=Phytophthora infestans TaxID=4787 RepID=A0A8S9UEP8_PHYIN|nr:hypothetical protein GN958_ATG11950 [Phytophthora infestans]KAF4144772.1 hypothetical protein GN958_ATG05940 [Phytophthora infestans]